MHDALSQTLSLKKLGLAIVGAIEIEPLLEAENKNKNLLQLLKSKGGEVSIGDAKDLAPP